jgi:Fic family protein
MGSSSPERPQNVPSLGAGLIVSYDTIMGFKVSLSPLMLKLCTEIATTLGRYEGLTGNAPQPRLRRANRIRTIQGSVAIEGNTLSLEQVTSLLDHKLVVGPKREILEVRNAIAAYERLADFKPHSTASLKAAHKILMEGLIPDAGKWRKGQVGILKGSKVGHLAPPAARVPALLDELFETLKKREDIHPLVRASWAHYEIEFIHPFSDGNGRAGRLWQAVHLFDFHPLFEFLPVESTIKDLQAEYYEALERSDRTRDPGAFIEFSLGAIHIALSDLMHELRPEPITPESRLERAREHFGSEKFSRAEYLKQFKTLSTATASRDLALGVEKKLLQRKGDRILARYRFRA